MNIINKLTVRQLKLNKKRTLITIIGVIISAAMITAVSTLGLAFADVMQRQAITNDGEWHVLYSSVNQMQLEAIKEDKETKTTILSREVGYASLEGSQNKNKPYVYIKEYNREGFVNFPIELSEGRLPENTNEIVISEAIRTNAKVEYNIGEVLNLTIGQRYLLNSVEGTEALLQFDSFQTDKDTAKEYLTKDATKTYTIVGIIKRPSWEPTWAPGYTVLSYVDDTFLTTEETVDAAVIVKHVDNTLFQHADKIASKNGILKVGYNNSLLRYYGVVKDDTVRSMLNKFSAIIIVIIMIGSISLIYNAFAISVSERSRHLGMLSSVGATKKQKRNSVFFEGAVIGAISIPLGILAGYVGIGITFLCINPIIKGALGVTQGFRLAVNPSSIIIAVMVTIITILVSTYIPARRASNISAIDAIRQTSDVKITRKSVKTSRITRKIFGIEGELGLKNLKRNKKRYQATVFSLIISMVLFLVVSSFTANLKKSILMTQDGINFDLRVTVDNKNEEAKANTINKIISQEDITAASIIKSIDLSSWIKEASMADYLKANSEGILENGKYPYQITVNVLDDEALKAYSKDIGADFNLLKDTGKLSAIVIDTITYSDMQTDKYIETKAVATKLGEKFDLTFNNPETNQSIPLQQVEVAALTNVMPMGIMSMGANAGFHIILSQYAFDKLTEGNAAISNSINTRIYLKSSNPIHLQESIEAIQISDGEGNIFVYNLYLYRQREQQLLLLVSVFTYAFILLITAICIANIFNTISTSISLRKREFAMLKSVGITPKGFNKMLNYESIFYGVKALLYGLPISFSAMYLIHQILKAKFNSDFIIQWGSVGVAIVAVFVIVGVAMLYSSNKVKKENIIDALKQEII